MVKEFLQDKEDYELKVELENEKIIDKEEENYMENEEMNLEYNKFYFAVFLIYLFKHLVLACILNCGIYISKIKK